MTKVAASCSESLRYYLALNLLLSGFALSITEEAAIISDSIIIKLHKGSPRYITR